MCGIAGIFRVDGERVNKSQLTVFTDSMKHRGPDGSGYELLNNEELGLGHRRLAILDLTEAGRQPMFLGSRYCITYNGEIFNFREIRLELTELGHQFHSETDTEVIMAAYAMWGHRCLEKFNGMWAFAIWDNERQELFLARDRFGIKPLYYVFEEGKQFVFASETRAFKYLSGFVREFDETLLRLNLDDLYALEGIGYTPFRGILQLLPAHYLVVKKGSGLQQMRWWHIRDHVSQEIPATLEAQAEKFYALFRDACKIRLVSDVPVATALSGGLDSTSVYTTVYDILQREDLHRASSDSQRAFTAVFPGLPNDEQKYAVEAARYTGGVIEYITCDEERLADTITTETELSDLIINSPIAAISAVYAGMRKKGIVVSLDGHGVDEMLFGYRDMVRSVYDNSIWNGKLTDAAAYADVLRGMYAEESKAAISQKLELELKKKSNRERKLMWKLKSILKSAKPSPAYLPPDLPSLSNDPYDFSSYPPEERMLYNEFFQHTLPALLRNFDRAGMINSIEIRMPFLDWRLVTYVFSLPMSSKLGNGYTKLVLREAMKNRMPEVLRTRTFKVGIGSPWASWMERGLRKWALTKISKQEANGDKHVTPVAINGLAPKEVWAKLNLILIS